MATIEEINEASDKKNGSSEESNKYIFKSMKNHADEIKDLFEKKDAHWQDETADMMIHCLCLFKREGVDEMDVLNLLEKRKNRFIERIEGIPEII